jgi:hypothetical protein
MASLPNDVAGGMAGLPGHEVDDSDLVIMTAWQRAWRLGISQVLSTAALLALKKALESNDQRLLQGSTTSPPPLQCVQDYAVEGACALAYCGWEGDGLETVGQVEEFFARTCYEADERLGEPSACRHFLHWFDETPRDEMRRQLLPEVQRVLAERQQAAA